MFVLPPWSTLDDDYIRCEPSLPRFQVGDGSGNGGGYYSQYLAVVTQNASGSDFLNATTNDEIKTALNRYNGQEVGGGLVFRLDDFPTSSQAVSFKQIHESDVLLFDMNELNQPARDFFEDVKNNRNLKNGFMILNQCQSEVNLDRFQMANLRSSFFRLKQRIAGRHSTERIAGRHSTGPPTITTTLPTIVQSPTPLRPSAPTAGTTNMIFFIMKSIIKFYVIIYLIISIMSTIIICL